MPKKQKPPKFNFEEMKAEATSPNPERRKKIFIEYFERFQEFPSYLFDNSSGIDTLLLQTIRDLITDPTTPKDMLKGLDLLMQRLPSPEPGVL